MTVVKTEGQHTGEYLLSEANGQLSREVGTVTSGSDALDGRVMKLVASKLVPAAGTLDSSGNSTEVIVGIMYGRTNASNTHPDGAADRKGVYISRMAEVKASNVTLHAVSGGGAVAATAGVKAALAKLNIVLR